MNAAAHKSDDARLVDVTASAGVRGSALPVFRRKGAYSMDCYSTSMKTLVLFYPFIPRRNTKAPEYISFRKSGTGAIRHFRFLRVKEYDPTSLIYRQVRRPPNKDSA